MAQTGVLQSDARLELLSGEIMDRSPIGPFHNGVTTCLTEVFGGHPKDGGAQEFKTPYGWVSIPSLNPI
jgi:hypothetical protein